MSFSKIVKKVSVAGAFGFLGMLGSDNAQAATFQDTAETTTLVVTATIDAQCSMSTKPVALNFSAYDFATAATVGASGTADFGVTCSDGVVWELHVSSVAGFVLADGVKPPIPYSLQETNSAGAVVDPLNPLVGTGTGLAQTATLYAEIAPNLQPADGTYTDSLVVDLWY